ncbi:MAG TPA: DUF6599 family protein [Candidatus Acidoferrales bacterium]|nr:DUF6599 family protein [Candidatus Acidoferrales bacterium]
MKILPSLLLIPGLLGAAIWPDAIGPYHRTAVTPVTFQDRALWDEFGLKESESARYENRSDGFTVTGYRLQDTTGAMAAYQWQRPAKSVPSKLAPMAAETPDSALVVHGNYLLWFQGRKPEPAELSAVQDSLRNVDTTVLPPLAGYLPSQGLVANSERYITGPAALQKFAPAIPPSVAGFHFGAEAQMAVFHGAKGDMPLAIFNYPTHQIAMQKEGEFAKVPGAMVKRSGPLVAVVLSPPDPDAAERLLSQIRFEANVTRDEYVPTRRDNIGNLVINAFELIGILLAFAVISGFALGGFRALRRRSRGGEEADALLTLHIDQYPPKP